MKIKKEVIFYFAWGIVIGFVSFTSLWFFNSVLMLNELNANILSWFVTNYVSFITNRKTVFHAQTTGIKDYFGQLTNFYISRTVTLAVEEIMLLRLVTMENRPLLPCKIITTVVVVILNYIFSKKFVFANKETGNMNDTCQLSEEEIRI